MLQYLIIILDDTSTSFCHYCNDNDHPRLMPVETLKKGLMFGMKENLQIQFVYPKYDLPQCYNQLIDSVDNSKIKPLGGNIEDADVLVCNNLDDLNQTSFPADKILTIRVNKEELFGKADIIKKNIIRAARINIVITDVECFSDDDISVYKSVLKTWSEVIKQTVVDGQLKQVNVLTDRIMLDEMNNCRAGDNTITLAPDGNFYVCPAFYHLKEKEGVGRNWLDTGSIDNGLKINNPQLYKLECSPICRICDAYQCRRCVWLNTMFTLEVNTPGRQQCIVAHVERNASRDLLESLKKTNDFRSETTIDEIDYMDPFEMIINNNSKI